MFSSEQTFTINGDSDVELGKVLRLALDISGQEVKSFYEDPNGLVLCGYECDGSTKYPFKATIPILVEQIKQYINDLSSENVLNLAGEAPDVDGTVRLGWETFHPEWDGEDKIEKNVMAAILAIRPCWIIYAK